MDTLTQSRLKELLHYDESTGVFTRRVALCNKVKVGDIAGTTEKEEYVRIEIDGKKYKAHRLAWLYVYGNFPEQQIDHINSIKNDNRIANLRDVSQSVNMRNIHKPNKDSITSQYRGVSWHKHAKKWVAQVVVDGRKVHLGYFSDEESAFDAYEYNKMRICPEAFEYE